MAASFIKTQYTAQCAALFQIKMAGVPLSVIYQIKCIDE